ncbi:MAG: hypothetical protein WKG07_29265 [Hymenobacter sp.]
MPAIDEAAAIANTADAVLVVGTSLQVYPAAGLLRYASARCPVYVIDPNQPTADRRGVRAAWPSRRVPACPRSCVNYWQQRRAQLFGHRLVQHSRN